MPKSAVWILASVSILSPALLPAADKAPAADKTKSSSAATVTWSDIAKLPDFWTGTWQGSSPMVDGPLKNVSYTDKAKDYIARYKPVADIGFAAAGCKTPGMPLVMQIAAMPLKFMVEPGMVAIYIEGNSQTRFIHMNQPHSNPVNPGYLGESVGHWEGDTLVVDTIGFVDDITLQYGVLNAAPGGAPGGLPGPPGGLPGGPPAGPPASLSFIKNVVFGPHGPNLRMVERMRLKDRNTLEIKNTITDPTIWTTPYETTRVWTRNTGPQARPMEWVCSEALNVYDPGSDTHLSEDPEEVLRKLEKEQ